MIIVARAMCELCEVLSVAFVCLFFWHLFVYALICCVCFFISCIQIFVFALVCAVFVFGLFSLVDDFLAFVCLFHFSSLVYLLDLSFLVLLFVYWLCLLL